MHVCEANRGVYIEPPNACTSWQIVCPCRSPLPSSELPVSTGMSIKALVCSLRVLLSRSAAAKPNRSVPRTPVKPVGPYVSSSHKHNHLHIYTFSHLADSFIQSDLQMRATEAINFSIKTNKNISKTKS